MKKVFQYFGGKRYFFIVLAIVAAAGFLRLYKLAEYVTYLGDQGRDAIVMKDIITGRDFTALGPITSVGSIYLGPFYYYFMAPWIGLFGLNPVGPAYGVAFISTASVVLFYLAVKDLTDKYLAMISTVFVAFSWVLIEYSRFSWNPNLLAPASFFTTYALIKAVSTNKLIWYALVGALISASVQLHYLAVFLIPIAGLVIVASIVKARNGTAVKAAKTTGVTILAFCILLAPFILFEVRHSFPNLTSAMKFSRENSTQDEPKDPVNEFTDTSAKLLNYTFQIKEPGKYITLFMIAILYVIPVGLLFRKRKDLPYANKMAILSVVSLSLLVGSSLYHGPKYPHYLGALYMLLYVQIAYLLRFIMTKPTRKSGMIFAVILLIAFIIFNGKRYIFLWQAEGGRQIDRAESVADTIISMNPVRPFTVTSSPEAYADYPYRYFLDAKGWKPVTKEEDSLITTKTLFVVCEKPCDPTGDPQWAIAHFSPKKITDEKTASGMYIYRLVK